MLKKMGYFLCGIGIHWLYPAWITMNEKQTHTHYRQCMRCGCLLHRWNSRAAMKDALKAEASRLNGVDAEPNETQR